MVTLNSISPEKISTAGEQQQQHTTEMQNLSHRMKSDYELSREERIRENRERMQKLGIVDISRNLRALKPTSKRAYHRKALPAPSPLSPPGSVRRSSRLQSSTPVSYCEIPATEKGKSSNAEDFLREEGSKPEFYTEEHEKLLGISEKNWTLFVDGYGKDGKRIYDPIKGKTCHQCRQKTLGHRTHCSKCNLVQGQFCGDCLYMRYGENVLEANENSNWICPVCRGICNCSLCRQAKGWAPTGILYRKISSLGYKSVAHYLIRTHRSDVDSDKISTPISAKRSLPFLDIEEETKAGDRLSKSSGEHLNPDPICQSNTEISDSKMALENGHPQTFRAEHALELEPEANVAAGFDGINTKVGSSGERLGSDWDSLPKANLEVEEEDSERKIAIEPSTDRLLLNNKCKDNEATDLKLEEQGTAMKTAIEPSNDRLLLNNKCKDNEATDLKLEEKGTAMKIAIEPTNDDKHLLKKCEDKEAMDLEPEEGTVAKIAMERLNDDNNPLFSKCEADKAEKGVSECEKSAKPAKKHAIRSESTPRNGNTSSEFTDVGSIASRLKKRRRA